MKPRRLRLSMPLLPTITETHEDAVQVGSPSQTLEEYVNSIKELAKPAYGPVRVTRTIRSHLFSKSLDKHSVTSSSPHCSRRTLRSSATTLSLDELTTSFSCHKDPVDWLFAQAQLPAPKDELRRTDSAAHPSAALRLLS